MLAKARHDAKRLAQTHNKGGKSMEYDWIGYAVANIYVFALERAQNRQRWNDASAVLMALKPSIQGPNKDKIVAAIDDTLERLKQAAVCRPRRVHRTCPSRGAVGRHSRDLLPSRLMVS